MKYSEKNEFIKERWGVPHLNFEGGPGVPPLSFKKGPGIPLLNFEEGPGSRVLGSRGLGSRGPGPTLTPYEKSTLLRTSLSRASDRLSIIQSRSFARVWNTQFIIFSFRARDSYPEENFWSQLATHSPEYHDIMSTKCKH